MKCKLVYQKEINTDSQIEERVLRRGCIKSGCVRNDGYHQIGRNNEN